MLDGKGGKGTVKWMVFMPPCFKGGAFELDNEVGPADFSELTDWKDGCPILLFLNSRTFFLVSFCIFRSYDIFKICIKFRFIVVNYFFNYFIAN